MANLRQFLSSELRTGSKTDIYLNKWPNIGNGTVDLLENLHVKVTGSGKVLGIEFKGSFEIIMPNESGSGVCSVAVNGARRDNCEYRVSGGRLTINHPDTQIILYADGKWSWVGINHPISAWLGIWPTGADTTADTFFGDVAPSPGHEHHAKQRQTEESAA